MAKRAYIGIGGTAEKIRKGYVGIDSAARKLKKAYIGIGGVARPCWAGGEIVYYGEITPLSTARRGCGTAVVSGFMLVAGGANAFTAGAANYDTVDAYDKTLTRTAVTSLSAAGWAIAGASINGEKAFLGGRYRAGSFLSNVDVYDDALTRSNTSLSQGKYNVRGTNVGCYALLAGGSVNSTYYYNVDAFDMDLTKTTPLSLLADCYSGGGNIAGVYALYPASSTGSSAYDADLTRVTAPILSHASGSYAVGSLARSGLVFGQYNTTMDVFDENLTRTTISPRSVASIPGVTALEDHVLAAGGYIASSGSWSDMVESFDSDLVRKVITSLPKQMSSNTPGTVGDFAIFPGGEPAGSGVTNSAYAYTFD